MDVGGLEQLFASYVVRPLDAVIFFDLAFWTPSVTVPLVVLWLVLGSIYFTARFQFVNFRAFRHAVNCVRTDCALNPRTAHGSLRVVLYSLSPLTRCPPHRGRTT